MNNSHKAMYCLLFIIVFVFLFSPKHIHAACFAGYAQINNCPSGGVSGSYTVTADIDGGKCRDACTGKDDLCGYEGEGCYVKNPQYRVNGGAWTTVPSKDISELLPRKTSTCNSSDCTIQGQRIRVQKTFSSPGTYKVEFRGEGCIGTNTTPTCTFTITSSDTTPPIADIQYPCGSGYGNCQNTTTWINSTSIYVRLDESDAGSGIDTNDGNVDIKSMPQGGTWPAWSDYLTTINNFSYTGQYCYFYKFRYQVKDNAGNLSLWSDPGYQAKIDTVNPSATIDWSPKAGDASPTTDNTIDIDLDESDAGSGIDVSDGNVLT